MRANQNKTRVILGVVATVLLIAAFGGAVYLFENILGDDEWDGQEEESGNPILYFGDAEYEITHNVHAYLLIGTDDSGNVEAKGTDKYEGQMADFLLLYVMDRTDNTYGFLQIDRNTMTDVPYMDRQGNGEGNIYEQICTAYWYGAEPEHGCNNTVYTVSQLLGEMPIEGYYSINMNDIGKLNHAVGGVEITLDEDFSDMDPEMKKGATLTLTDEQAEIYVRGRMSVGEGTNEERMARQQNYMKAYMDKAKKMIGEDPNFVNDLYEELDADSLTNIPENRISVMANQMYKGEDQGILKIDGKTKIGTTLDDGQEHEEFYADMDSIADCMVKLCGIDEDHITVYE